MAEHYGYQVWLGRGDPPLGLTGEDATAGSSGAVATEPFVARDAWMTWGRGQQHVEQGNPAFRGGTGSRVDQEDQGDHESQKSRPLNERGEGALEGGVEHQQADDRAQNRDDDVLPT